MPEVKFHEEFFLNLLGRLTKDEQIIAVRAVVALMPDAINLPGVQQWVKENASLITTKAGWPGRNREKE